MRISILSRAICALLLVSASLATTGVASAADAAPQQRSGVEVLNQIRLRRLTQDLSLTDEQQKKVKLLFDDEAKAIGVVQADEKLDLGQKLDKQDVIKAGTKKKVQEILTPEQRAKWDDLGKATKKKKPAKADAGDKKP